MKFFSLFKKGDIHLASGRKIIPQEEYLTLLSAEEVLEKAKEDAMAYQKQNEKTCEDLRETAKKEGFDVGLAQFYEHILGFEQELKRMRQEMQKNILPIALKAAKKIVAKQLDLNPETIVDIVMQTLTPLTQSRRVIIYVNKADKERLDAHRPKIKELFEQIESLNIQERNDLSQGSCIIETESGIINASLENQWHALEQAFEKYRKQGG